MLWEAPSPTRVMLPFLGLHSAIGEMSPPHSWVGVRTEAEPALLIPPGLGPCWWMLVDTPPVSDRRGGICRGTHSKAGRQDCGPHCSPDLWIRLRERVMFAAAAAPL